MDTLYKANREREELIEKIDTLAKLYLAAEEPKEKRAIYSRLVNYRIALSKHHEYNDVNAVQLLRTNFKNNVSFLN